MRVTLLTTGLVVSVLLIGTAGAGRADESLDEIKRQQKIAADKFEADLRDALAAAAKKALTQPAAAAKDLEGTEAQLEFTRAISAERKQEWQSIISARIKQYRQQSAGKAPIGGTDSIRREIAERQREQEARAADQSRLLKQMADLRSKGDFAGASSLADQMRTKYGASPASIAAGRTAGLQDALTTLRGVRDERDTRYRRAMVEVMRSAMPITGEVEFPPNWAELTKRRTKTNLTPKEEALLKALNTPITLQFKDQPIQAVLEEIEKKYGVSIDVDKIGLEQAGLNSESQVSVNAKDKTLRSVLKKMLGDVGLTFSIRKEGLRVTTPQRAADDMVIRAYYIGDLFQGTGTTFDPFTNQLQMVQSVASLINMIQSIDPQSWESGGGKGTIMFNPGTMSIIVKQSAEMQFSLQGWLK